MVASLAIFPLALTSSADAASVVITRVWPEKIVCKPGETAKITVDLENTTPAALTGAVTLAINHGLAERDELPGQPTILAAGSKATVTFFYPVPPGHKWGQAAEAQFGAAARSGEHQPGLFRRRLCRGCRGGGSVRGGVGHGEACSQAEAHTAVAARAAVSIRRTGPARRTRLAPMAPFMPLMTRSAASFQPR